ncbi:ABC transporter ATP-binding protein [Paenibacillus sp. strain BS8-2]
MAAYRWIVSYLRPYGWQLGLFTMLSLFISGVELAVVWFIQYFIDGIGPSGDGSRALRMVVPLLVLAFMMVGAQALSNRLRRHFQELATRDLIKALFRHLRTLGFDYSERHPNGEIIGLFHTDVRSAQLFYERFVPSTIQQLLLLAVFSAYAIYTSWQLSLIVIPCFLTYYIIGPYFAKQASIGAKEANVLRRAANKQLYDTVSGLHEVRAYYRQAWSINRLIERYRNYHRVELRRYMFNYLRSSTRLIATGLGSVAVLAMGIWMVKNGRMSLGEFAAFSIVYSRVMVTLTSFVVLLTEQRVQLQQAAGMHDLILQTPSVREPDSPRLLDRVQGELALDRVSFDYPSRPGVIRDFSLHIRPGEKVALVGESGGGKSTLLKLFARLYDPTSGTVTLDGVPVRELSFHQLHTKIGYVFQETYLFGGTVRDNILFGQPDATAEQIEAAARAAYAHEFILALPNGYDSIIGERGITLSGGQRQRIAIARMFIKNPAIVLLDEATSALDTVSEREVQSALEALLTGRTTIAVAHRLSTVRHYDRIVVVNDGRNAEMGTYEQLMTANGIFRKLVLARKQEWGDSA